MDIKSFEECLRQSNMAENTISAYLYAIKEFYSRHKDLNKKNLLIYKTYLIEKFKPKTVNLRIQAMNKYLDCMGKSRLRLKSVKVQQRSYLENVISNADYVFLKNKLKRKKIKNGISLFTFSLPQVHELANLFSWRWNTYK